MDSRKLRLYESRGGKSFVGIKFSGNGIDFYYPEFYRFGVELPRGEIPLDGGIDDKISHGIRSILSGIELARTRSREVSALYDSGVFTDEPFALRAYIDLICDFMKNGYYKNRETVYRENGGGRINWKRTLKNQPIYSDGSFVYRDLVTQGKSSVDNLLVRIHRYCVRKSMYLVGWLFNIRFGTQGVATPADLTLSAQERAQYIAALRYEQKRTFDDEKRSRISNMLDVVTGLNRAQGGTLVYGVDGFHYVFESMVDRVYGTVRNKEAYYPHSVWQGGDLDGAICGSPLMPDSILESDDATVIIDAKCYRYAGEGYRKGGISGLPATDSVQKQITYGEFLQGRSEKTVYNCFLLPYRGEKGELCDTGLYATGDWRKKSDRTYERVYVYLLDIGDLIDGYAVGADKKKQELLIKSLKEHFEKEKEE